MTPQEELELIDIELELRKRRGSAPVKVEATPAQAVEPASSVPSPESKPDWAALGPEDRVKLLAKSFPKYFGQEILGIAKGAEGMVERSVAPALGQALGRFSRIPGAERLLGGLGGVAGEAIAEKREGSEIQPGRLASAFISGLVKGRGLTNAGAKEVAREGAKYAAVDAVGTTTESLIDRGKLPSATELAVRSGTAAAGAPIAKAFSVKSLREGAREPLYDMEMEVLRDLRKEGITIPPHEIEKGLGPVSGIAGKLDLQQDSAKRNQFGWQRLAREEIGLSKEAAPIRREELFQLREKLGAPYREIQRIQAEAKKQLDDRLKILANSSDPHAAQVAMEEPAMKESLSILSTLAAADVEALKIARASAAKHRKAFKAGDPNAYEPWQAAKSESEALEDAIDRAGQSLKDDKLLSDLRASRQKIAQTYNVEAALNPGNGFVDDLEIGRQLKAGVPLSGNLEVMGRFANAFRREAVESGRVPAPGVGMVRWLAAAGMASRGDVPGLVGAGAILAGPPTTRAILLSDTVQNNLLSPAERQNFAAKLARYIAENAAEDPQVDELMALEERRN